MSKLSLSASLAGLVTLGTLLVSAASAPAQGVGNRIAAIQPNAARAAVSHTVNPRAGAAADLGTLPPSTPVQSMTLRFSLTPAQETALEALEAAQQNPASAGYHQWLTPQQYGAQFGLSDADLSTVTAWLAAQGFTGIEPARSRSFVTFSGTAAQVQAAFGTTLHQLSLNGEQHFANLQDATLPAALAGVVGSITGLDDFRLKSRAHVRSVPAPEYTSSISGNHFIAPGDFYTIYDLNPQLGNSINGSGITIAVMGQTDISLADAAAFRTASGLPANPPTIQLFGADPGVPSTGDLEEAMLDVEWSGAVAPSASILFVNATDVIAGSLTQAIDNNLAPLITISYGNCEAGFGAANLAIYNQLLRQATVQGQTVLGPAGDSGAADCDNSVASAINGLAVDFPASSPFVTAVGGTMFNEGGGLYFGTGNGAFSGSALSYIPEAVWNESSALNGIAAGGGGASTTFAKPTYQLGTGVPNDGFREVPDLAFNAAANHDGYLICAQGSCTNGYRNAAGNLNVVGGTSVSTPAMAGIMALLEQKIKTRVGNANPTIYALANSNFYSTVFHDVTVGSNAVPCTVGSVGCTTGTIGYPATAGYDQATGWGSLDVNSFITDWPIVAASSNTIASTFQPTVTTATPSTASVTAGQPVTIAVSVASSTGLATVPTGTVQLVVDGSNIITSGSLVGGKVTLTLLTTTLTSGAHSVTVLYNGDSVFAGSSSILSENVINSIAPDFALTPTTGTITTKSGTNSAGLTFTVTPVNGFVGNVTFTASSASNLNATYGFSVLPVVISSAAAGSTVFTLQAYTTQLKTGSGLVRQGAGAQAHLTPIPSAFGSGWKLAGGGIAMASLLLFCVPGKRRRVTGVLVAVLSVGLLAVSGCSSNAAFSTIGTVNTPPGTYTVVVTATATNAAGTTITAHNSTVTFVVQ